MSDSLQNRMDRWMAECFTPDIVNDVVERGDRFCEESIELLQANGYDRERILRLVDYVYGRPVGDPFQEVGGVLLALSAYCSALDIDMDVAGEVEMMRVWTKMDQIRAKQAAKRDIHGPLP